MNHRNLSLLAAAMILAGCGSGSDSSDSYSDAAGMPAMEAMPVGAMAPDAVMVTASKRAPRPAPPSSENDTETIDADTRMLAYQYGATFMLPAKRVALTLTAHEQACTNAGPATCQLIASNVNENGEDYVYGNLEIRAKPEWLASFRAGLKDDAAKAEGKLSGISVRAEDLTRTITDTAARLEAQRALRERLLALMERDTDNIGDLLQIEREIARVQSEIESAESYLRILRARVSMDRMTLDYQTLPRAVSPRTTQPLVRAFTRFFGELSESLASLILFLARILPWMLIGLPILWILLRFANQFRKRG